MGIGTFFCMPTDFSQWLERQLKLRELPIRQFAIQVGVTAEAAGYWVSGDRHPRKKYLVGIATALGLDTSDVANHWAGVTQSTGKFIVQGEVIGLGGPGGKKLRVTQKILKQMELEAEFSEGDAQAAEV